MRHVAGPGKTFISSSVRRKWRHPSVAPKATSPTWVLNTLPAAPYLVPIFAFPPEQLYYTNDGDVSGDYELQVWIIIILFWLVRCWSIRARNVSLVVALDPLTGG